LLNLRKHKSLHRDMGSLGGRILVFYGGPYSSQLTPDERFRYGNGLN
jgi:hypothetical protein